MHTIKNENGLQFTFSQVLYKALDSDVKRHILPIKLSEDAIVYIQRIDYIKSIKNYDSVMELYRLKVRRIVTDIRGQSTHTHFDKCAFVLL